MAISHAKALRQSMTDAEQRLWYRLRAHRLKSFKFKRQAPIGKYIVDFICFERRLIIEIDGGQHDGQLSDAERSHWLSDQGFRIVRFWNNEVLNNTDAVLGQIVDVLNACAVYPSPGTPLRGAPPSPARGEGTTGQ
ncbi:MAG: endonuclease domain-containing protein [Pseudomonadota bacterium]